MDCMDIKINSFDKAMGISKTWELTSNMTTLEAKDIRSQPSHN